MKNTVITVKNEYTCGNFAAHVERDSDGEINIEISDTVNKRLIAEISNLEERQTLHDLQSLIEAVLNQPMDKPKGWV